MATKLPPKKQAKEHESLKWIVVLQMVGENVRVQPDWRSAMKIGDTVQFLSPSGKVNVEFEPAKGMDAPCGIKEIKDKKVHKVINRSGGVMQCTVVKRDGKVFGYKRHEALAKIAKRQGKRPPVNESAGSRYCTGGAC